MTLASYSSALQLLGSNLLLLSATYNFLQSFSTAAEAAETLQGGLHRFHGLHRLTGAQDRTMVRASG